MIRSKTVLTQIPTTLFLQDTNTRHIHEIYITLINRIPFLCFSRLRNLIIDS